MSWHSRLDFVAILVTEVSKCKVAVRSFVLWVKCGAVVYFAAVLQIEQASREIVQYRQES